MLFVCAFMFLWWGIHIFFSRIFVCSCLPSLDHSISSLYVWHCSHIPNRPNYIRVYCDLFILEKFCLFFRCQSEKRETRLFRQTHRIICRSWAHTYEIQHMNISFIEIELESLPEVHCRMNCMIYDIIRVYIVDLPDSCRDRRRSLVHSNRSTAKTDRNSETKILPNNWCVFNVNCRCRRGIKEIISTNIQSFFF